MFVYLHHVCQRWLCLHKAARLDIEPAHLGSISELAKTLAPLVCQLELACLACEPARKAATSQVHSWLVHAMQQWQQQQFKYAEGNKPAITNRVIIPSVQQSKTHRAIQHMHNELWASKWQVQTSRSIQAAIIRVQVQQKVQEFRSSHKQKYMQSNTFQAKS